MQYFSLTRHTISNMYETLLKGKINITIGTITICTQTMKLFMLAQPTVGVAQGASDVPHVRKSVYQPPIVLGEERELSGTDNPTDNLYRWYLFVAKNISNTRIEYKYIHQ